MAGTTVYKGVSSVNFVKLLRGELNDPPFLQDGIATAGEVYKDRDSSMYYYCHTTTPSAQTTPVSTYFSDTPISIKRSEKRIRELEESKLDASDLVDVPEDDSTKVLSAKGGKYLEDKIDTMPQLIDFGPYTEHNSTSELLAIPINFKKFSITTTVANNHNNDYVTYGSCGSSASVVEGTFKFHSRDDDYYYYYFSSSETDNYYSLFAK